jgi:protein-disulfide isomerase
MRKAAPVLLLRLALLIALFACAVLVVDYENAGDPTFCGAGSGCMAVRRSVYSHIADVPLPVLGLSAQAVLLALALVAREKEHTFFIAVAAAAGGVVGLALIGIQAVQIGAFCKWCLCVDVSAMVAAVAAGVVHYQTQASKEHEAWLAALAARREQALIWGGGAVLVAALPFLWGEYPVVPPLPPGIAALAVPGKVTMVAFTDFQCPYCRKLHPNLRKIEKGAGDRLTLVRRMMPLDGHPGARPAALAYLCAPEEQREAMAELLYTVPEAQLTRAGTLALAATMALDAPAFERCLDAPATQARLAADMALFDEIHAAALPYTYIGSRVVAGFNPTIAAKLARYALAGDRPSLPVAWMFGALAVVVAGLIGASLKLLPDEDAISPR